MAQYGLLDDFIAEYKSYDTAQLKILPTFKYRYKLDNPGKALERLGSKVVVDRLNTLIKTESTEVSLDINDHDLNSILTLDIPGLDAGELILFAALKSSDSQFLTTGDKRAVKALPNTIEFEHCLGRILLIEQIILLLINRIGFTVVAEKIRKHTEVDTALRLCFGSSAPSNKETSLNALNSYIMDVEHSCQAKYLVEEFH